MTASHVLSIDAGTTSVRCLAVAPDASITTQSRRDVTQHYPQPGWVEHDAAEIWEKVRACVIDVCACSEVDVDSIQAIGITNQRETVVAWDRATGEPVGPAIVWQDRRTADRCTELRADGSEEVIRRITGLGCDPYFSATKMEWLLGPGGVKITDTLALGTIDAWLAYKLTGGAFVTDASNASRTLLFDLSTGDWSDELLGRFGVPRHALPEIVDSCGVIASTDPAVLSGVEVPLAGIAGDQQSALFGQACFETAMAKNTYGTGSFVLVNAGTERPPASEQLLSTVAWRIAGETTFALEGSIFVTGAAISWLRDKLGLIDTAADAGPIAESVTDSAGIVVVPALAGLGAPHWNPYARGAVFGLGRGATKPHLVRAVIEAMAYLTRDVVESMRTLLGQDLLEMRVDGGASVMDLLCQIQADQLGIDVVRPTNTETTATGAAFLAGLATGQWSSLNDIATTWRCERRFTPTQETTATQEGYERWGRAVQRVIAYG